ncbi:PREDICTED: uncharacterized protein LOC109483684 [Branchiostoma belcheri]|uniref:Uncharacterized protein LOC109483684 n=1 Tax=Branchiostoma belcheri TaxID=7741 RepID=A0A6P5A7Q5_BRABE|nr:PREDICTED: uncharacterized protein LOC109483684 [Branchiostoma belcheri]
MASAKLTFLHTVNNFAVVGLLITPMVVNYWRGTWGLMDQFLLPQDLIYSPWVSVAIGIPLLLLLNLLQSPLRRLVGRIDSCVLQHACHILYIYVHGFANVNHWRGVWKLLDGYAGINVPSVIVCTVLAIAVKTVMRTLYNLLAPPILVATDFRPTTEPRSPRRVPGEPDTDGQCTRKDCQRCVADIVMDDMVQQSITQ